jgi:PKD repeat protein
LGDGNTSTDQNPVHPYGVGVWNVTLEVSSLGRTWNLTKTNYINITLPAVVAETQPIIILSASDNNWTIGLVGCIGIIGLLGLIFRRK